MVKSMTGFGRGFLEQDKKFYCRNEKCKP
ncbi:hypothetical protein CFSAN002368_04283 [Clostridium botulinum A1 str. CFSAN002368]|nr:hypothetical protein CFSAN002368_04283 [Clostridium botulinum A1 str. CFSAN002368]